MSSRRHSSGIYSSQLYASIGRKLYLSDETADFHFVFGSDSAEVELVPVHKYVLAAGSEAFHKKFNGPWKESSGVKAPKDVSSAAFKEFLRFFYFDHVTVTKELVDELLNLGEKFHVVECVDVCRKFLEQ